MLKGDLKGFEYNKTHYEKYFRVHIDVMFWFVYGRSFSNINKVANK